MSAKSIAYGRVAPTIRVRDLGVARAFYVETLGFRVAFENGDPTCFAILKKDAAEIHLAADRHHRPSAITAAHMFAEDIDALYGHCVEHGVRIVRPLEDKDYGQRAFVLADPDANLIDIGGRTAKTIIGAEPQLFVSDVDRALAFFVEMLGFAVAFAWGEPASYAQVVREGARINLRHVDGPAFDAGFRSREADALSVTVTVEGIDALFAEYEAKAVPFHQSLRTERWEARTFIVSGPDANLIAFAGR